MAEVYFTAIARVSDGLIVASYFNSPEVAGPKDTFLSTIKKMATNSVQEETAPNSIKLPPWQLPLRPHMHTHTHTHTHTASCTSDRSATILYSVVVCDDLPICAIVTRDLKTKLNPISGLASSLTISSGCGWF